MIQKVEHNKEIIAIIIRHSYNKEGISFFTPDDFSQQLGYMNRPEGYVIKPHVHRAVERQISLTQEVLYIKSGKVRVDFYDNDRKYIESSLLLPGDVILLAGGGHGFKMIEPSEMVEVKQGPFVGEADKFRFETISDEEVRWLPDGV